jgi:hypothetical protein
MPKSRHAVPRGQLTCFEFLSGTSNFRLRSNAARNAQHYSVFALIQVRFPLAAAYGPLLPGLSSFFRFSDAGDEIEGSLALDLRKLSTIGHRFERSLFDEAVISGMVVVVLITGVVWSLPDAEFKRRLTPVLQPIASAAGLEQSWRIFAPEPLRRLEFLEVHVTMADGVQRIWTNPRGDRVVGAFAWYRWQKVKENVVHHPASRVGVARWVVHQLTRHGERAARVQMILRSELLPAPGTDGPPTRGEEVLYDEKLTSRP